MEFHTFSLPNGIRVIHKRTNRQVGHCGLVINAGSRDELDNEQGLAHFIEHSIFKGTKRRKTYHILSRLDAVGGEINAYTTKEETWIYASFLNDHYERALDLIADISFNSIFPEKELKKERAVIIDEINSYRDNPGEMIFDDFEEHLFRSHSLGRNILGTIDSVNSLSRDDIFNLIGRRYTTDQMVFSSVSNLSLREVKRLAKKYLGDIPASTTSQKREAFSPNGSIHQELEKDIHQVHYILGSIACSYDDNRRTAMVLLNNLIGGPAMNSRLNLSVREKHGIAYHIESNYTPYSDTGMFQVYLGTDKKSFAKSKKLVNKVLAELRERKLGPTQLHQAKQQLSGQIALAQESGVGTMIALGKSMLLYDKVDSIDEIFTKIDGLKASDVIEVAEEVLDPEKMSSISYIY